MVENKYHLQIAALLCVFLRLGYGCSERSVVEHIFQNYTKLVRPVLLQNTTLNIQFELRLYNIISMDEPEESLNLLLWTTSLWYDQFLTWNPENFGDCTIVKVAADQIWSPDIYFTNTLGIQSIAPSDSNFASVTSDGQIRLALKYNAKLGCTMSIDDFPFDTQTCPITVGLWTYNYTEAVLYLRYPVNGLAPMNGDPKFAPIMGNASEFETVTFSALEVEVTVGHQSYSELHYKVGLKRRPEYYIYVLLVPSFLLASLCIIGIFTPNSNINERNERVTLGLTTLLSMAVILNIVADQMPKSAHGLPLLGIFVCFEIGTCTFAIILSTIIIIAHQRAHTRKWNPPAICYWIARGRVSKTNCKVSPTRPTNGKQPCSEEGDLDSNSNKTDGNGSGQQMNVQPESCSMLRQSIEDMVNRMQSDEDEEYRATVWQICFDTLDSVLMAFLLLLNTGVAFIIIS